MSDIEDLNCSQEQSSNKPSLLEEISKKAEIKEPENEEAPPVDPNVQVQYKKDAELPKVNVENNSSADGGFLHKKLTINMPKPGATTNFDEPLQDAPIVKLPDSGFMEAFIKV